MESRLLAVPGAALKARLATISKKSEKNRGTMPAGAQALSEVPVRTQYKSQGRKGGLVPLPRW